VLAGKDRPPLAGPELGKLFGWLQTFGAAVCVAGIMLCGAGMALAHRRGGQYASRLGWVLGACLLLGSAASIASVLVG
jgi:type IV secretory pathway VirB2 component (pilin)